MKGKRGFGLIELMISMVLMAIVMIAIYRFWIKSTQTLGDKVAISVLKQKVQIAFDIVSKDLKSIGYNPTQATDASNSLLYRVNARTLPASSNIVYDRLLYSFDNEERVPGCRDVATNPFRGTCTNYLINPGLMDCDCIEYSVKTLNAGTPNEMRVLQRNFNDSLALDQKQNMILLSHVCLRFLFCIVNKNSGQLDCTLPRQGFASGQPRMIKLVLAAGVSNEVAKAFETDTASAAPTAITSCIDNNSASTPYRPCCDVSDPLFKEGVDYIRMERLIKLDNLR